MRPTYKKWLEDGCPKVICGCGCSSEIIITKWHKYYGIPKYIHGHQPKGENHPNFGKTGEDAPFFGKHHSKETIEKMRLAKEGDKNSSKRLEVRQKISEAKKGYHHSKETIEKISKNHADVSGENNPNFNDWASKGEYCEKWDEPLRESIRNEYGRKCFLCGKDENNNITKKGKVRKLSVHHIDADKEQGCNGKKWKLVPVCLKCHSKIHKHTIYVEK